MSDDEAESSDSSRYTHEQKIVAAVWVHEKEYNNQTWKDINSNFLARFNAPPPNRTTFLSWERKLFSQGNVDDKEKCGRPLSRLMHVPYVRSSLKEAPDLSLRERSKLLGLPRTTLLKIIRDDLNMEFEVEEDGTSNLKRRHAPYGGGKWKKKATGEQAGHEQCKLEDQERGTCD
ncbi:hypothetical protein MTP99_012773 [Tenebrio molitor]|jgi:hypothetical protein|uniref:Uncharacterized protein n=1 Tax=Tenebrio molitor TaxID=7067 RepID=A0A8J6LBY4_TENMO|nr:hypothetical protein GEV33_007790 [Tenebrio molitor]KAJ3631657.1 hypothetical protein MTP99_012773 [Tenebrio molitor]CAH1371286.1 unnamed protein product [Tenebrio molitor]